MQMTGAEIFVRALTDLGVDIASATPVGAVLNIYDALFKNTKVRHLLCRHEQGAVHMADGYARASGKTGLCLVTSGPADPRRPWDAVRAALGSRVRLGHMGHAKAILRYVRTVMFPVAP